MPERPTLSRSHPIRWLPALLIALAMCPGASQAQKMVSVDRPVIHMRDGAGTKHMARWQVARGYPLKVVGQRGGWLKVQDFERDSGWVLGRLTARKPHVIVKVPTANIRSGPGTKNRRLGRAEYGEVLRTLTHRNGWVRVKQQDGPTGWIARRLLWGW